MAEIDDLSITDASNTARFPENQAPSSVNNGARALEGIIARWHEDTNGSVASTGSANAYLFAAKQTLSAYYDGLTITFDANFTNTAAATLNVDSVSADAIVWPDGGTLSPNQIQSGAKVTVRHDGTNWQLSSGAERKVLLTPQATTSGTAFDFTDVGSNINRATVIFDGNSLSGTDSFLVQIGDSGGFETATYISTSVSTAGPIVSTSGFVVANNLAGQGAIGHMVLTLSDSSTNKWDASHSMRLSSTVATHGGGSRALDSALTQIRITRSGTDTFDAGAINVLLE